MKAKGNEPADKALLNQLLNLFLDSSLSFLVLSLNRDSSFLLGPEQPRILFPLLGLKPS